MTNPRKAVRRKFGIIPSSLKAWGLRPRLYVTDQPERRLRLRQRPLDLDCDLWMGTLSLLLQWGPHHSNPFGCVHSALPPAEKKGTCFLEFTGTWVYLANQYTTWRQLATLQLMVSRWLNPNLTLPPPQSRRQPFRLIQ